jgi:hypothetical protein
MTKNGKRRERIIIRKTPSYYMNMVVVKFTRAPEDLLGFPCIATLQSFLLYHISLFTVRPASNLPYLKVSVHLGKRTPA